MMANARVGSMVVALALAGVLAGGCSSSSSKSSSAAAPPTTAANGDKAAFCADNIKVDKASNGVADPTAIIGVFKANLATIDDLTVTAPSEIKADAQILVNGVHTAITANSLTGIDVNALQAAGARVDAYCGVQSDGTPIPANAGQGKGSQFCSDQAAINASLQSANDSASIVAALKGDTAKIADFSAHIPSTLTADAQVLITAAAAAIAANDGTKIMTPEVQSASTHVDTYCGVTPNTGGSPTTVAETTTTA